MKKYLLIISFLISLISFSKDIMAQKADQEKAYHSFGGHVFSGDFPIKLGEVYLYDAFFPTEVIDIAIIDTLGYYYFYRKPVGYYFVKARLTMEDPNFSQFGTTYYPNVARWEDAEVIYLNENNWEYDIKLIHLETDPQPNGPGTISGTIIHIDNKPVLEGVDVVLFDEQMEILTHIPTDHSGQFSFENLDYGTYILYPQIPGMTTKPMEITISENNTEFEDLEISVENGYISSTVNDVLIDDGSLKIFPNPSTTYFNIQFSTKGNSNVITRVSDIGGRIIFEENKKLNSSYFSTSLQTTNWSEGYYFVEILIDGNVATTQKLIITH